eukprot:TRINITY_DN20713_c0_g1_i1.p1 TRINITY_DN20713_c0_g1~~TRINITY_DN20713_c0_g1_i1.p1  ORF type:complete len:272 (+),score=61.68 TRINITY_DN20713_c0_g1_i1:173-988(+)
MLRSLVGSEMCIRDRYQRQSTGNLVHHTLKLKLKHTHPRPSMSVKSLEKRVAKELQKLQAGGEVTVSAKPRGDDLRLWDAVVAGPVDTAYEGGEFHVVLPLPVEYPFKPPKPQFRTKVYHPNIKSDGTMCAAWLETNWRPNMFLREVLEYIYGILAAPDPDDAIEPEVANVFTSDRELFEKKAREWTVKYAGSGEPNVAENTTAEQSAPDTTRPLTQPEELLGADKKVIAQEASQSITKRASPPRIQAVSAKGDVAISPRTKKQKIDDSSK